MQQINLKKLRRLLRKLDLRVDFGPDQAFHLGEPNRHRRKQRIIMLSRHQATGPLPDKLGRSAVQALCHELGHYLVAPEGRRRLTDYGIPEKSEEQLKWRVEEVKAVLVQHMLMKRLGFKKPSLGILIVTQGKSAFEKASEWWKKNGRAQINYTLDLLMA